MSIMAMPKEGVTFYLKGMDGKIKTRRTIISWPFGQKTIGRTRQEDGFNPMTIKKIVFEGGVLVTHDEDIAEFLKVYNQGGVAKISGVEVYVNPTPVPNIISVEKPKETVKTVTNNVEVEKIVIPRVIAESMDAASLRAMAINLKCNIPADMVEHAEIMKALDKDGIIKDFQ